MHVNISASLLDMIDAFVAVILLYLFLQWKAFPPIAKALKDRQNRIAADLEAAERARQEAERLRDDLAAEVREVHQKVEAALSRALRDAEAEAHDIVNRARLEAKRLVEDAQGEIVAERDKALLAVRGHVVDLAMDVAERVLSERLDAQQDRGLFEQFVHQLDKPS